MPYSDDVFDCQNYSKWQNCLFRHWTMVIEQSARDTAVLATFVLVLMIQWKGVTGDNLRRSRETSWDDDVLEFEASREPFRNDEEFVGDSLQHELRGSEQSENVDNAFGDQEIQQDLEELDPELQEDQLFSEGEGDSRAQQTELETQDDQQLQLEKFRDKENNEDESQHTSRESKGALQLQQQHLPNDEIGHDKAHRPLVKMEESRQLQKEQPLSGEKGESRAQRAQQEVEEDQQPQQKSPNEENGTIRFRQARADEKDNQQLQQEQLRSAEKTTVVFQSAQPEVKEDQQLQQEQLPNGMKGDTGVPHDRLEIRDNHELQQEELSKEGNSEVRARHTPVEMEEVNWKLPHVSVSNEQKGEVRAQRAELETKQKWEIQGQQLSNEEEGGKSHRHVKFGTEENHQQKDLQNEEKVEVDNYPRKMDAGDILQHNQNQFDIGHKGAVSAQHGQMEASNVRKLQQEKGKGNVNDQVDVDQLQLRQLAAFGRIVDSVRRNQEVGKQLKPDEMPGDWMKPAVGKEAALHIGPSDVEKLHPNGNTPMGNRLATSKQLKPDEIPGVWMQPDNNGKVAAGPSSVETLHPNENNAVANSDHVELAASEKIVSSKQRTELESPAAVRDEILMSPSDTAEKDLMHDVRVGEDELHPRESIGTSDSIGWQQPSKVGETEDRVSDTLHRAEQWLKTSGSKSADQELPAVGHRDGPAGVEMKHRPQDEYQSGAERQHLRKPVDASHRAHVEKVKKRTRTKEASKEQQRARRRNKAAAAAASRAQRQHLHRALPRPQRQQWPKEYEPDDVPRAAVLASVASSEPPVGSVRLSVALPEPLELATSTAPTAEGEPVGKVAVVLVSSPPEPAVGLPSIPATVPPLELDITTTVSAGINAIVSASISSNVSVNTSASTNVSTSENSNDNTSAEPLLPVSSERDAAALRVVQGVQRRAQQSERLRLQILPALRSSLPPSEAEAGAGTEAGVQGGACNGTAPQESASCQRRRLLDRALRAVQQLRRLEEQGEPCPAPTPPDRTCLRQLLQFAPGPAGGQGDLSRRIRHLQRLVADYEKLTAAEKRQVQGVRDYLARQLSRLYSLSQAATPPPDSAREVTESQPQEQAQPQPQPQGREAAAAALLERLRRHGQLPPRPLAFQHRLQRRLASRHRRDAYAQLALSAANARFHMPAA